MRCFLPFCTSTTDKRSAFVKNGGKGHFFRGPNTEEKLQVWRDAISACGYEVTKYLKNKDVLCDLHFTDDDICWNYPERKMPDNTIFSMRREKPALKANVVPSIFVPTIVKKESQEYVHFLAGDDKVHSESVYASVSSHGSC